jgi:flagellar hook-basal body complex protein FliE
MTGFEGLAGDLIPRARVLPQGPGLESAPADALRAGPRFGDFVRDALQGVESLSDEADAQLAAIARGEPVEPHDLMIAIGKSEVAFELMLEIRNKLVEAWHTLSRSVV